VATSGPWHTDDDGPIVETTWKVYKVHDVSLVSPLTKDPDVLSNVGPSQGSWLPVAQRWYADPADWSQQLVAGGPSSWARTTTPTNPPSGRPQPTVHVSDVKVGTDTVSFHVDRIGVPVLVRVSYFPNWNATGALGPWRSEPNLMVVVPTSHNVTLTYGSDGAGRLGLALSVLGVLALVVLIRRRAFVAATWSALLARAPRQVGSRGP
jgi:hypothetical protein